MVQNPFTFPGLKYCERHYTNGCKNCKDFFCFILEISKVSPNSLDQIPEGGI